jgi:predicted acyltransferase
MLLMLFVNDIGDTDLGHIDAAPWWLHHMPGDCDGMTLADAIFPAFLFIVGLSIPIALERRIARGDSMLSLAWHVVSRAAAMIFIGLCMVNGCHGVHLNEKALGMSGALWRTLMLLSIILLWLRWPNSPGAKRWLGIAVRVIAAATLVYLLAVYRGELEGKDVWLRTRWWGIVGLIGWSYLIAAFVWLACRDYGAAVSGALALLVAVNIGGKCGALYWWPECFRGWLPHLAGLAALSSMAVAGLVVATLFQPGAAATTPPRRIAWMLVFAAGFGAAGLLLRPLWGIHKDGSTPSWTLCSVAIACAVYALLYWLIDVLKLTRSAVLLGPAGSNTLLMYMLPQLFYSLLALLGIEYLQTHFHEGWPGVARSAVLALSLVAVTAGLTRCRVRLQV